MAAKMDKSLDDIIAEQRTKAKQQPRGGGKGDQKSSAAPRGSSRQADGRRETRRSGPKHDGPPPREGGYYMHDDRDGGFGGRGQQGGVPRGSWKQQQREQWDSQQQWQGRPRGRGAAAAVTDPIITTADGWEEVAQDEPYSDRRGYGAQRRGGVFDRLSRDNGSGYSRRGGREQQYGGGRFARGRGRGGRGRGDFADGEPRRRYVDEHDHREDEPAGRPGRFQPYRVAGGVSKRSGRPGPVRGKWGHDLYDDNQPEGPVGGEEYAGEEGMME